MSIQETLQYYKNITNITLFLVFCHKSRYNIVEK